MSIDDQAKPNKYLKLRCAIDLNDWLAPSGEDILDRVRRIQDDIRMPLYDLLPLQDVSQEPGCLLIHTSDRCNTRLELSKGELFAAALANEHQDHPCFPANRIIGYIRTKHIYLVAGEIQAILDAYPTITHILFMGRVVGQTNDWDCLQKVCRNTMKGVGLIGNPFAVIPVDYLSTEVSPDELMYISQERSRLQKIKQKPSLERRRIARDRGLPMKVNKEPTIQATVTPEAKRRYNKLTRSQRVEFDSRVSDYYIWLCDQIGKNSNAMMNSSTGTSTDPTNRKPKPNQIPNHDHPHHDHDYKPGTSNQDESKIAVQITPRPLR
jgi:hypothetical protein